jgi:hypothetical protein
MTKTPIVTVYSIGGGGKGLPTNLIRKVKFCCRAEHIGNNLLTYYFY